MIVDVDPEGAASAEDYREVFQSFAGRRVLGELSAKFFARSSFAVGDPYTTAFREGERNVVLFIFGRLGEGLGKEV